MFNCSKFLLAEFIHPVWQRRRQLRCRCHRYVSSCCCIFCFAPFSFRFILYSIHMVWYFFSYVFFCCSSYRVITGWAYVILICEYVDEWMMAMPIPCFLPSTPTIKNKKIGTKNSTWWSHELNDRERERARAYYT